MKTGSSLNPYAASYVPLFKRGVVDANKEFGSAQEFNSGNEVGQFGYRPVSTFPQGQHQNVSQSHPQNAGAPQTAEYPKWKDHRSSEFVASTSQYPEKPSSFDEDSDMDLAYLQMIFPGISEESLSDVYQANRCDLDSAVDMLNQLEIQPDDSSDKLPDTLDIGDVPDSVPVLVKAPQEAKNATGGASTSASSNDMPAKS
ncbi:polyadenylate-binding protein-interacting protein 6-like [Salvia miltiorrhiza]|uniref:polyadenylate-binding protein-interacting protein 6-like n=1 Tax=Salvia miltiorrhiza TaxID=226208 RepID=UPI0025AC7805|nr:polyadenylate-binding protein-interacting protein 6-like [Salvia miltiorrhiza]